MEVSVATLILAVCIAEVTSQPILTPKPWEAPSEWDPALDINYYPNPTNEPGKCKQTSSEFWLCDPNGNLTPTQSQFIIDHIRRSQEGTKHKILVGVALVNRLKLLSQEEVPQKTAYCGAYILNTTWSEFKSSCGDNCAGYVYMFLSWNDFQQFIDLKIKDALPNDVKQDVNNLPKLLNPSNVNSIFEYINATLSVAGKYAEGQYDDKPLTTSSSSSLLVWSSLLMLMQQLLNFFVWIKM